MKEHGYQINVVFVIDTTESMKRHMDRIKTMILHWYDDIGTAPII